MISLVRTLVGQEEIDAVTRVIRSGQLAAGPEVGAFEREFAELCGTRFAVAVNSGTAAIHAALQAVGVGPGDEVLTTPFTFAATATPILMLGAVPRFVDINEDTFNVDSVALAQHVTPKTKAVIVVDLFGLPVDREAFGQLRENGVAIVEDACQAVTASRDGIKAGAIGDVGCFSFYATKNLMTGEGGMVTTDDETIADSCRRFRQHGQGARYEYLSLGYNYRMTDIAAAIGRVQLTRMETAQTRRVEIAKKYSKGLATIPGIKTPHVPAGAVHAYHQYSVLVDSEKTKTGISRDRLKDELSSRAIGCGVYYPTPLHQSPLFAPYAPPAGTLFVAERVATQILALPIHPLLSDAEADQVIDAIAEVCGC